MRKGNEPVVAAAGSNVYLASHYTFAGVRTLNVDSWNGASWSQLGTALNINSAVDSATPSMVVGGATPYVAWTEQTGAGLGWEVRVKSWNGTSWVQLGGVVSTVGRNAYAPRLAWDGTDLWVTYREVGTQDLVVVRKWTVASSSWSTIGGPLNRDATMGVQNPDITTIGGTPYVIWAEAVGAPWTYYLSSWSGSAWTPLGGQVAQAVGPRIPRVANDGSQAIVVYPSTPNSVYMSRWTGSAFAPVPGDNGTNRVELGDRPAVAVANGLPYMTFNMQMGYNQEERGLLQWDGSKLVREVPSHNNSPTGYDMEVMLASNGTSIFTASIGWTGIRVQRWSPSRHRVRLYPVADRPAPLDWSFRINSACGSVTTNMWSIIDDDPPNGATIGTPALCSTTIPDAHLTSLSNSTVASAAFDLTNAPADLVTATDLYITLQAGHVGGRTETLTPEIHKADGTLLVGAPALRLDNNVAGVPAAEQLWSFRITDLALTKSDVDGLYVQLKGVVSGSGSGTSAYVQAVVVDVGYDGGPENSAPPTIAGTVAVGSTLTASPGTWTGSPTGYTYQWRRCSATCSDIVGATGATFAPTTSEIGTTLYVVVTATNAIGPGTAQSAPTVPVPVQPMISAGGHHTAWLRSTGTVWTFGGNQVNQLGDGTTASSLIPVQVLTGPATPLTNITQVAAGWKHTAALKDDGTVWSWGGNACGQVGNGNFADQAYAVQVKQGAGFLTGVTAVAAGWNTTWALKSDGTAWVVGVQHGAGSNTCTSGAVQVKTAAATNLTSVVEISASAYGNGAAARRSDGSIWGVGENGTGQLGIGNNTGPDICNPGVGQFACSFYAVQMQQSAGVPLVGVTSLAKGALSIHFVKAGNVYGVGLNSNGELADTTTVDRLYPVQGRDGVALITDAVQVWAGAQHAFIRRSDNSTWAVGDNRHGTLALGNTTTIYNYRPMPFAFASAWPGAWHAGFTKSDGTVWTSGLNDRGQLANCTTTSSSTAAQPLLTCAPAGSHTPWGLQQFLADGVTALAAGGNTYGTTVVLKFSMADQDFPQNMTPWIEILPVATPYSTSACGTAAAGRIAGTLAASPGANQAMVASFTVSGLVDGTSYHWRACAAGSTGPASGWETFHPGFPEGAWYFYDPLAFSIGGPPINTVLPVISPAASTGVTLSTTTGTWTAASTPTYTYQWRRCDSAGNGCVDIVGATSSTYLVLAGDSGSTLRVVVTATTSGGVGTATSVQTNVVATAPTVTDNQAGDLTWRSTNSGTYDVDFSDATALTKFETQVWSGPAQTGVLLQTWTQVAALSGTLYTTNWALLASTWTAMGAGTNYVSVRVTNSAAITTTAIDVFYVQKDVAAAPPASVNDGNPGDVAWWTSTTTMSAAWPASGGEVGFSGVSRYDLCVSTLAACAGTVVQPWVSVGSATSVSNMALAAAMVNGTAYVVSVRMADIAGNLSGSVSSNGFTVDSTGPAVPVLLTPASGATWADTTPNLVASYSDPGSGVDTGSVLYEVCTVNPLPAQTCAAAGGTLSASGTTAGVSSGTNATWTVVPALANGTYWWRARAQDRASTLSAWAGGFQLIIGTPSMTLVVDAATVATTPGAVAPGAEATATSTLTVSTSNATGYLLTATDASDTFGMQQVAVDTVPDWTGTDVSPTVWATATSGYFGVTTLSATGGKDTVRWGTGSTATDFVNNRYVGLRNTTTTLIHQRNTYSAASDTVVTAYRVNFSTAELSGTYGANVAYSATASP